MLKKTKVSATEEKRVVTGMVVSTQFIERIKPMLDLNYFTNTYLKEIALWCDVHFEEHGEAPNKHIKDRFEIEQGNMKDTEIEMIDKLLTDLDNQYDDEEINVDYLVDTALDYFRGRALEIAVNNVTILNENGDREEAERVFEDFIKVKADIGDAHFINPGNLEQQEEIYQERDKQEMGFFKHPGDLGKYLGNWKRGDVVGYFGPAKRGKTWVLIDNFKQSILQNKRTIFWPIEMTRIEVLPRFNKAFFPTLNVGEDAGIHTFPMFDCKHNQTGECVDRLSPTVVIDEGTGELIHDPAHIPCKKCAMSGNFREQKRYSKKVYEASMMRQPDDIFEMRDNIKRYQKMWNKYGRIPARPKYTLTYDDMMRDIDTLWIKHKWVPDILIIDYIDILTIGSKFDDYRLDDEKWKLLAKIAGETNCLVITATQANKAGHESKNLDATHQGGFYGKNRHVNMMIGLNQSPEDKKQGIMRFGITEARSIGYNPGETCDVLQDFKTGQSHLESYFDKDQRFKKGDK